MVLGKGSFGKAGVSCVKLCNWEYCEGDASREERNRWAVCYQDPEERHHYTGWWYRVHYDREEGAGTGSETTFPCSDTFLLPNNG